MMVHAEAIAPVLSELLRTYVLPLNGPHGIAHWARVLETGVRLVESTSANLAVVRLFAVLHDSKRLNEGHDPEHGPRAAEASVDLRGKFFDLSDDEFSLLYVACADHTTERTHPDVTVQTCWDADRLDLGRVMILPRRDRLCTQAAKSVEVLDWANQRAYGNEVPEFVGSVWKIDWEKIARMGYHPR
jgi:uncharacterized protein